MSSAVTRIWTSEEFFNLPPSKKVRRWLLQGELRESKMTKRNPHHSYALIKLGQLLANWVDLHTEPTGIIVGGECYFRIRQDPETNIGVDLALTTYEQKASLTLDMAYINGPPILIAEVLSLYDKLKIMYQKVHEFLDCGVQIVLTIDPYDQSVKVYRPNSSVELFDPTQILENFPELPGFACPVRSLFL